jgi:5-bromo-4-chloroindolyl phosphate hydrolysis protein
VSNQVKRKAEDWICDRPAKIIHQELNSQKQCLETLTSKDIQYIRNNFGREKRKTFPKLPKSSVDVQNALNVLDIRTIIKDEQFLFQRSH